MNIPGSALCPHLVSTAHQRSTDWATVKARVGGSPNRFKPVKGQIKINFGVEKPIKGLTILHLMKTKSKSKWMSRFQSIYPTGNQSKIKTCSIFASKYRKIPRMIDHVQHETVQCHLSSPKVNWFYLTGQTKRSRTFEIIDFRNFFVANITSTRVKLASKFDGTEIIVRFESQYSSLDFSPE